MRKLKLLDLVTPKNPSEKLSIGLVVGMSDFELSIGPVLYVEDIATKEKSNWIPYQLDRLVRDEPPLGPDPHDHIPDATKKVRACLICRDGEYLEYGQTCSSCSRTNNSLEVRMELEYFVKERKTGRSITVSSRESELVDFKTAVVRLAQMILNQVEDDLMGLQELVRIDGEVTR